MKTLVNSVIFMLMIGLIAPITGQAAGFNDVKTGDRFTKEIMFLTSRNVISGFSDGSFKPNDAVTRAQAAIMIGRALDLNGEQRKTIFNDVEPTAVASGYIASAVERGIISGFQDGTYRPSQPVTRGQMAIFLNRAFDMADEKTTSFKDVSPGMAAYQSIVNVTAEGIANGYADGTYRPNLPITRGQFSAFLARALEPSFRDTPTLAIKSISGWEKGASMIEVDIDHEWVIEFNDELDERSLYENIYAVSESDKQVRAVEPLFYNPKSVKLHLVDLYDFDESYALYITKDIQSKTGNPLAEPMTLKFHTTKPEFTLKKSIEQDGVQFEMMLAHSDEKIYAKVKATNVSSKTIPYVGYNGCDPGISAKLFIETEDGQVNIGSKWHTVAACTQDVSEHHLKPGASIEVVEVLYPSVQTTNGNIYAKVTFQRGEIKENSTIKPIEISIPLKNFE
ncbi:S-layer homology domain-containing protein [Sporosarcina sp. HYO08]|uniref:S-layer homology domain-containing protein n=1 Tax=Sporosarcina sp. HYO08 TaxID=1759557 RepID=UPI00079A18FC|nr:S-layer homology domain-containing protein [Sporosarcina sp. HYO08]KXH81963.1 hypothetical protein AU377_06805 [Sporosarcina sp. HYO08]